MSGRHKPAAALFAALGDGTRLQMMRRLSAAGPLSITRLASGSQLTRQAVAKHVRVLEAAGLLRGRRRGRERILQLNPERLSEAQRQLESISRRWDAALGRLKKLLEEEE